MSEPFWFIHVAHQSPDGKSCSFKWDRGHLFDLDVATILYEACVEDQEAHVLQVMHNPQAMIPAYCNFSMSHRLVQQHLDMLGPCFGDPGISGTSAMLLNTCP